MVRTVIVIAALGAVALAGCNRDSGQSHAGQRDTRIVADVVARVGGHSIGVADLERRMASEEIDAAAALQQLIDEELLVQEAKRFEFTEDRDGERTIERLMVRSMLHDLEQENTPESISDKEVRASFAKHADEFEVLERRRSWHILVTEQSDAGKALAELILRQLREANDPRSVYELYADGGPEGTELEVKAEDLPAITTKAKMAKSYKRALFAAKSVGPLEKVVKTPYGWHAIVVAEILPGESGSIGDVEPEIRERLSQAKRFQKIVEIIQDLEAQGLVQYDEKVVKRLLSMSGLPERTE